MKKIKIIAIVMAAVLAASFAACKGPQDKKSEDPAGTDAVSTDNAATDPVSTEAPATETAIAETATPEGQSDDKASYYASYPKSDDFGIMGSGMRIEMSKGDKKITAEIYSNYSRWTAGDDSILLVVKDGKAYYSGSVINMETGESSSAVICADIPEGQNPLSSEFNEIPINVEAVTKCEYIATIEVSGVEYDSVKMYVEDDGEDGSEPSEMVLDALVHAGQKKIHRIEGTMGDERIVVIFDDAGAEVGIPEGAAESTYENLVSAYGFGLFGIIAAVSV